MVGGDAGGRVVAVTRVRRRPRTGACPSSAARAPTSGGPATAAQEPASRAAPTSGEGSVWSGWRTPSPTSGRVSAIGASSSSPRAPEQWTTSEPARRPGAIAAATAPIARVGRGHDDEVGVRPGLDRRAGDGRRTAPLPRRHSTRRGGVRRPRRSRGRASASAIAIAVPARPGPTSATVAPTCAGAARSCDPPNPAREGAGCSGQRAGMLKDRSVRRTPSQSPPCSRRATGASSPSGTITKPRSHIRGCGTSRSGSCTSSRTDQQDVDVERPRAPALHPDPVRRLLESLPELEQLAGGAASCRAPRPR